MMGDKTCSNIELRRRVRCAIVRVLYIHPGQCLRHVSVLAHALCVLMMRAAPFELRYPVETSAPSVPRAASIICVVYALCTRPSRDPARVQAPRGEPSLRSSHPIRGSFS